MRSIERGAVYERYRAIGCHIGNAHDPVGPRGIGRYVDQSFGKTEYLQGCFQGIAVVGFVADNANRQFVEKTSVECGVYQSYFVRTSVSSLLFQRVRGLADISTVGVVEDRR